MNKLDKVIVALDHMPLPDVERFLSQNDEHIGMIKIGLELFCKHGPEVVLYLSRNYETKIFLDLKLHDIPQTVYQSIQSLAGLPISFLTIHLTGGRQMLLAAKEAQEKFLPDTKLLGVSFLTSLDAVNLKETFNFNQDQIEDQFKMLFNLAQQTHIQGIVCSPFEANLAKKTGNLITVCPGIRFQDEISSGQQQDQKRVCHPKEAIEKGADYLVIGRSLTQSKNLENRYNELHSLFHGQ